MRTPFMLGCLAALAVSPTPAAERPNVLLIMVDDLGHSDLGCYGSEIETPNLDRLAADGLRFSQFYNTAKCHSSRIAMLTGRYAYQAGQTSLKHASTTAELLGHAGYHTMMVGKWHLDGNPMDFGFHRYFGHLSGACNYYLGDKTFRLDREPWEVPQEAFYTTVAKVDYALEFLAEARSTQPNQPWYLHLAFNAPHAPLQPLKEDYLKYQGRYSKGWDAIHEARATRQNELGLYGRDLTATPRPDHIPAWKDLEPERRHWEERRMTALAAMIDRVDQEIGRLLADLEAHDELDNTFLLFVSDNGACPYDRRSPHQDREPYEPDVTWGDSTGWSWVRNTPFRFYKQNQFEGGICTPGIAHWPAGLKTKPGAVVSDPVHLVDVLPTLADLSGAEIPATWPDRDLRPVSGTSIRRVLEGEPLGPRDPIYFLFGSDRGLRDGPWKLVSFRSNPWELYHLEEDRTEQHNLAQRHPEIRDAMIAKWTRLAEEMDHAPTASYKPVLAAPTASSMQHPEWTAFDQKLGPIGKRVEPKSPPIRARKDTKMQWQREVMVLTCDEGDPGLAFDHLPGLQQAGPYRIRFEVSSDASGGAELYWTEDPETRLPDGAHLPFEITHDGQWQRISLPIATEAILHGFRLDPCEGAGTVKIREMQLVDASGKTLIQWDRKTRK